MLNFAKITSIAVIYVKQIPTGRQTSVKN